MKKKKKILTNISVNIINWVSSSTGYHHHFDYCQFFFEQIFTILTQSQHDDDYPISKISISVNQQQQKQLMIDNAQ